jgi:MFS family permease
VLVNVTVVIPTASLVGSSLFDAALIISSYSVGALAGLGLFYTVGRSSVRTAYLLHAVFMCIGNAGFYLAAGAFGAPNFLGLLGSRAVIGLEGAVMFNASVALIEFSSPKLWVRYLALYQFFVGLGLVLGPGLAALCLLVGEEMDLPVPHAIVNLVLAVWGTGLGVSIIIFMPDNDTLAQQARELPDVDESTWLLAPKGDSPQGGSPDNAPQNADDESAETHMMLYAKMLSGNCLRISLRILWEAGSAVIFVRQFGFSFVAAALFLSAYGVAQTVAQVTYAYSNPPSAQALAWLEVLQLLGILLMFAFGLKAASMPYMLVLVAFVLASTFIYCANCLSSAPFQSVLLNSADEIGAERETLLLVAQVGVFLGVLIGPLSILCAMMFYGATVDTLAAVLLVGWVLQALVTALSALSLSLSLSISPPAPPRPPTLDAKA